MLQNTRNKQKQNRINWFLVAIMCDELAFSFRESTAYSMTEFLAAGFCFR